MEIKSDKLEINNRRYLGSKTKLIDFITTTIEKEGIKFNSFAELFGGTGVVSYYFYKKNKRIIINDMLESNRVVYNTFFGSEPIDENKIAKLINDYNNLKRLRNNYFSDNFSDTFFSFTNCKKIGYIREDIENRFKRNEINVREKDYLISSLIYAMDKIANTVGHYDAYRKQGNLNFELKLKLFNVLNKQNSNSIYKTDANLLAKTIKADMVYIDPPYNSRQYCDAYHLLENVACWNKPEVFGVAKKMDRSTLKSKYCEKSAPRAFNELISDLNCKYILVSYNNMGSKGAGRSQAKITDEQILTILRSKGKVKIFETDFNQFTTGKTFIDGHKERLFLCIVGQNDKYKETDRNNWAKSPLNYTGGKYSLLDQIINKFPIGDYCFVDLFGGGFNVGANVLYQDVIYNDINKPLTRLVKLFYHESPLKIIDKLDILISKYGLSDTEKNGYEFYGCTSNNGLGKYNKVRYLKLREDYNTSPTSREKDYLLLLLIIFGFNNQIRFNSKNEFNTPVGKRDFNAKLRKNLFSFCNKIKNKNLKFFSQDFKNLKFKKDKHMFFYCDPPYFLGDASYNENGLWNEKKDEELFGYLDRLNRQGCKFAMSNVIEHKGKKNYALLNWALKNKYNINYLNKNYNNSNYQKHSRKSETVEVLITNY